MARSKKFKSSDVGSLSPSDRQALERVAAIFKKPVPEVLRELSSDTSPATHPPVEPPHARTMESESVHLRALPTPQPGEGDNSEPFSFPEFLRTPESLNQTELGPVGDKTYTGDTGLFSDRSGVNIERWHWDTGSDQFTGVGVQNRPSVHATGARLLPQLHSLTNFFTEADLVNMDADTMGTINSGQRAQGNAESAGGCGYTVMSLPWVEGSSSDPTSNDLGITELGDSPSPDENQYTIPENETAENEQSVGEGHHVSSASASSSQWSLVSVPEQSETTRSASPPSSSKEGSLLWIPSGFGSKKASTHQQQRRGPFQNKQLREETSNTRKMKACVRCRMQKIRCLPNDGDPHGACRTCQAVSKQKIHTLQCARYKITECTLYRTGKAPGLEFTFRWPVMKLKDISKWADPKIRTIAVQADICPIPLELSVRKFEPIPQDRTTKSWMDGKVKKFKQTTPYAIVNMNATVKVMKEHVNANIFICLDSFLEGRDPLVLETFAFARQHMRRASSEDERLLLRNVFQLWFAIRRTATTEHIVGEDTLDMVPETEDRSYPLFGKVPLPPVMIQQLDMILTLGLLQPLAKRVLEEFQRIVLTNKPKSWMTIYLCTFIFLHSCAALSEENYSNARKHGLKRRYAMPTFISELHHGANVFLSHYHYCTQACDPFTLQWSKRETTPFAESTVDEIHFILHTAEMVKERKDKIRIANEISLYEDDLYFVSQMFDKDWTPRDTIMDFDNDTVSGAPLRRFYEAK